MNNRCLFALALGLAGSLGVSFGQATPNPIPARILGQLNRPATYSETVNPLSVTPNLLEGRELFGPVAVALDTSADPPAVFVSDTKNNRILGWKNAAQFDRGAFADIVIGQRDFYSSAAVTPTTVTHSSLNLPAAMALGPGGNLFVYDAGNNRILRFPKPFDPANATQSADMVIGQQTRTARNPNQSTDSAALPKANTLKSSQLVASRLTTYLSCLTFDPEGNLWATDAGNHRVLRYASSVVNGPGNVQTNGTVDPQISANRVLGQPGMELANPNPARISSIQDKINKQLMRGPAALAFDSAGNLYVSDDLARVLFYRNPGESDGKPADRILGIPSVGGFTPVNDTMFGFRALETNQAIYGEGARGVFCIGDVPFVVDTLNSRILRFPKPEEWPPESVLNSPKASGVIGQFDFISGQPNKYEHWEPSPTSFRNPSTAIFVPSMNEVWVADTDNNRVMAFPNFLEAGDNAEARKLLGQVAYEYRAPNFIQGREFSAGSLASSVVLYPAAVVDRTGQTPRLYIADPGNNRILAWADARKAKGGDFADIVIGQVDFYRALVNSPTSNPNQPNGTGLSRPSALAVDSGGNLWVADSGNSRVLRYPRPFDDPGRQQVPDLVIGQESLDSVPQVNPNAATLALPAGIAFSLTGQLYVSDMVYHRVLRFDPPFQNGLAASVVFGQPDFGATSSGSGADKLNAPMGIAVDSDDRLLVADSGNNRIAAFNRANLESSNGVNAGAPIKITNGSMQPRAVHVSHRDGSIFVVDTANSAVRKFEPYTILQAMLGLTGNLTSTYAFQGAGPRNLTLDADGNILVLDSVSRMTFHYPQLYATNWESGFLRLAPGLNTRVQIPGVKLVADNSEVKAGPAPLPKELEGYEIFVNGVAAPIFSISESGGASTLKIQIPSSAPTQGVAEILIQKKDTQQIIASQVQQFGRQSPAFLVQNPPGGGQIVAFNADGTPNSAANPAVRGTEITLHLIGYGQIDAPPEDGTASEATVPMDGLLYIGGAAACGPTLLCEAPVSSSTLDATVPGLWKIKAKLNPNVTGIPTSNYAVGAVLIYRDSLTNSYILNGQDVRISTTVAIKP